MHDAYGDRLSQMSFLLFLSDGYTSGRTLFFLDRASGRAARDLKKLKGPVLGHFATQDQWINQEMVSGFEAAMDSVGKRYRNHWYEANHAFANPSSGRYDEDDAQLAWERTLAFFKTNL